MGKLLMGYVIENIRYFLKNLDLGLATGDPNFNFRPTILGIKS
jgi:hypothetical protein